ncbi:hypothetical protein [Micromonospora fulviviridis]|uniref:Uncharacterized protein n=1 Tax=Micromonospora fulviviridis TaxID=47860 RepID=A0ABV2VW44_9ACTN
MAVESMKVRPLGPNLHDRVVTDGGGEQVTQLVDAGDVKFTG